MFWGEHWQCTVDRCRTRRGMIRAAMGGLAILGATQLPGRSAWAQESTPCPATTPEEAMSLAKAYFAAFNDADVAALDALLAANYSHHGAVVARQDRELHKERLRVNAAAFPDGYYDVQDLFAEGDLVVARWVFTGTLQGPYGGVEPKGQPVAVRGVHIHRVACGQIVETWNSGDALGLLRQIGAIPTADVVVRTPLRNATPLPIAAADCPPGSAAESAAIARRWTEEALDTHDLNLLNAIVAKDVVHHAGIFVDEIGRDALKADLTALLAAFPDARFSADVVVATPDRAAVRWTARGTNDGPFQGRHSTGIAVEFSGINVYRIACGEILEGWSEVDALGLLRQLAMLPQIQPVPAASPTS